MGYNHICWTLSECFNQSNYAQVYDDELDVHHSVHRDTIMKVTNKMQLYRLIYYS